MRLTLIALLFAACADNTPAPQPDLSTAANPDLTPGAPTLTVNNTLSWCTVTVTIPNQTAVTFSNNNHAFMAPSGTTVMLHAVPNPTFQPVKWTGVTTMNGADATYVMTAAGMQMVTACCPLSNGTGC